MTIRQALLRVGIPVIALTIAGASSAAFADGNQGGNYGNKCGNGYGGNTIELFDGPSGHGDLKCNPKANALGLTGTGVCQADGSFLITWDITNPSHHDTLTITSPVALIGTTIAP